MGRQEETFYDAEKNFLRVHVRSQVVQDVLLSNIKNKLTVATNIIWPLYKETFNKAFPAETPAAFALRQRYARANRRQELSQKPGETLDDVEKRMDERFGVSSSLRSCILLEDHLLS